eukprot:187270-Karenia_brevis.AAC.1
MRSSFGNKLSLIQGPPGTGKTKIAAAILATQKSVGEHVLACAHTHLAIDELGVRLLQSQMAVTRFGDWRSIKQAFTAAIWPHSVEYK